MKIRKTLSINEIDRAADDPSAHYLRVAMCDFVTVHRKNSTPVRGSQCDQVALCVCYDEYPVKWLFSR